jgi:hypothetical protein
MKTIRNLNIGDFATSGKDFAVVKEENGVYYYANYDCVDISDNDIIHTVSDIDTDYLEDDNYDFGMDANWR